jgi:hypothetical protein
MTDYLAEIKNILSSSTLDIIAVKNLYHNIILDNAMYVISNSAPDKVYKYVEEFLANSIYLLELGEEPDSRIQLNAAVEILLHIH